MTEDPARRQRLFQDTTAALQRGDFAGAEQSARRLLAEDPSAAPHHLLGIALLQQDRAQDALPQLAAALALNPSDAGIAANHGVALFNTGRADLALDSFDRALRLMPDMPALLSWRGKALWNLGQHEAALASFDRALALAPDFVEALSNRATILWGALGRAEAAARDLEQVVALDPAQPYALGELQYLKLYVGDWSRLAARRKQIDDGVRAGRRVVKPFAYQALSQSPAELQACSRIFAADLFRNIAPRWFPSDAQDAKIRIGYVSGEFHDQATAYLMAGIYEAHDRARFDVIAFDNGIDDGGTMRRRLEASFDRMIDIAGMDDARAASRIREEKIDLLVNLNGYFGKDRSGVFAQRPAPVQVNYLGFPATMGTGFMDYIIADGVVIPDGEEAFYDEAVVRLPHSYQANDNKRAIADAAETRAANGLPHDAFVFCNFNQSYKLLPAAFDAWMRILKDVPGSVLWLLQGPPGFADNLRRAAQARGVAAERLVFAAMRPQAGHLARLKLADLFLDSLPYNAHTTASDALWAGLPLLTCRGNAFPGRVAASLLLAAGLPELVTESMADYHAAALALARDPARLAGLRDRLAANRLTCPLFDTARLTRHLEAAFAQMVARARRGAAPQAFDIAP